MKELNLERIIKESVKEVLGQTLKNYCELPGVISLLKSLEELASEYIDYCNENDYDISDIITTRWDFEVDNVLKDNLLASISDIAKEMK